MLLSLAGRRIVCEIVSIGQFVLFVSRFFSHGGWVVLSQSAQMKQSQLAYM